MSSGDESCLRAVSVNPGSGIQEEDLLSICRIARSGSALYGGRNTIWSLNWRGQELAIKSFGVPWGIRKWVYGFLRPSKARRSFENAMRLRGLGVHTPTPFGYAEFGSRLALLASHYVSILLPSTPETFSIRDVLLDPVWPKRQQLLMEFGRYTSRLHKLGVRHRDYSPGNIFITKTSSDAEGEAKGAESRTTYQFSLVDLNRMSFGPIEAEVRMANLKMLWADDADLAQIVDGYAEASGEPAKELLSLALASSHRHKRKAIREERLKAWLRRIMGTRVGSMNAPDDHVANHVASKSNDGRVA